jgi:two-component system response regulator HydG
MSQSRLLIVHPDPSVCGLMTSMLQTMGHRIEEAANDRVAVRMLEHDSVHLIVAGADPADADALEFLVYLRRKHPQIPVILLFSAPHQERTREALQRGAAAVLRFPLPATHLRAAVAQALGEPEFASNPVHSAKSVANGISTGNGHSAHPANSIHGATNGHTGTKSIPSGYNHAKPGANGHGPAAPTPTLIGEDPSLRNAIELAASIAPTRAPVLIVGERGTGKTLLARTLHHRSPRRDAPFIEVNCTGLRENVLEVELFGRKGPAFNDPGIERQGKLAKAQGGTLYIDDVAALSPALQHKLLRVLQDGEFEPVGSSQTVRCDVRVIVAAEQSLSDLVEEGRFRQDLHYRISVVTLKLSPLQHRGTDIERLAEHFRARFAHDIGKHVIGFSHDALELLRHHSWPGNVAELESAVERAVVMCRGGRIEPAQLELNSRETPSPRPAGGHRGTASLGIMPLKEALEEPEKQLILQALEALNWNRQETARVLDINRTTLYKKMKKYGLLYDEPVWAN